MLTEEEPEGEPEEPEEEEEEDEEEEEESDEELHRASATGMTRRRSDSFNQSFNEERRKKKTQTKICGTEAETRSSANRPPQRSVAIFSTRQSEKSQREFSGFFAIFNGGIRAAGCWLLD